MWATLTLMTALSVLPGQEQAGGLKLTNERVTYGIMGPTRTEKVFIPGDTFFLTFDIEGLQNKEGGIHYSMKMELVDSKGAPKFPPHVEDQDLTDVFGGGRIRGFATANLGIDTLPGEYTLKLTITDLIAKKTQTLAHKFEVGKKDFGLVGVVCTYEGRTPAPQMLVIGQPLVLIYGLAGFERDAKTSQPQLRIELQVLDEAGKPTLAKPITADINKDVEAKITVINDAFPMWMTRAGKFTIELKATDLLSKKSSSVALPLTILDLAK